MLAVGFFGLELYLRRIERETLRWPSTRGRIVTAKIKRHDETLCNDDLTDRHCGVQSDCKKVVFHRADVVYAYSVNCRPCRGRNYSGRKRIVDTSKCAEAVRFIESYPKGKRVRVYYNPEKPQKALLKVGASKRVFSTQTATVVLLFLNLFFGLLLLIRFLSWRQDREDQENQVAAEIPENFDTVTDAYRVRH
jgi:hypothetical protein